MFKSILPCFYSCDSMGFMEQHSLKWCLTKALMHTDIHVANAESGVVCTKSEEGYPCNLPVRHLFTRSRGEERTHWIAMASTTSESGLNHNGRATRNANRVYHYDLADIGSPITLGVDANRCSISAFDIYLNRPSQKISPREFCRLSSERNVRGRFISKLFTQLI